MRPFFYAIGGIKRKIAVLRRSVALKWTVSYLCLMLIMIAVNVVIYTGVKNVMREEITKKNQFMLEALRDETDRQLRDIMDLASSVTNNKRLQQLAVMPKEQMEENFALLSGMSADLSALMPVSEPFEAVYLYFEQADIVVAPSNILASSTYFKGFHESSAMTYTQWLELISRDSHNALLKREKKDGGNQYFYICKQALGLTYGKRQYASLVIVLDEKAFQERGRRLAEASDAAVFILDKNEMQIPCSEIGVDLKIDTAVLDAAGDFENYANPEAECLISAARSSVWGDTFYITAIPYSSFWRQLIFIKWFTVLGVLLTLLVCGGLTLYFVKQNYRSVGDILKIAKRYNKEWDAAGGNEFRMIQQTLAKAVDSSRANETRVEKQKRILRNHYLQRLLLGKIQDFSEVRGMLMYYQINFSTDRFAVMAFLVDPDVPLLVDEGEGERELVDFVMTNVLEELLNREHNGVMIPVEDYLVCIVNFHGELDDESAMSVLEEINDYAKTFLFQQFGIRYDVFISDMHHELAAIPKAFDEVAVMIDYQSMIDTTTSVFYRDLFEDTRRFEGYTPEKEYMLSERVKLGRLDEAKEFVSHMFAQAAERKAPPVVMKCMAYGMANTILQAGGATRDEESLALEPLAQAEKTSELCTALGSLLEVVCKEARKQQSAAAQIAQRITTYIEQNYSDESLSVAEIAEHMKMNASYLSTVFKEHTGDGILERINSIRIDRATELLKNSYLSISETAAAVGYLNVKTFSRLFKKRYGITPSQYKEKL